jgi:hypothetical protein
MGSFFDEPTETVRIDTDQMVTVIQFGGAANLSNAQEHVLINLKRGDYEAALGLRVLVELNKEFPLATKYDAKAKANKVVIPSSIKLKTYVDRAIDYFVREHGIGMELQPIRKK